MKKEIKEELEEIMLEISAFNRNSEKFQKAFNWILELFEQEKQKSYEDGWNACLEELKI